MPHRALHALHLGGHRARVPRHQPGGGFLTDYVCFGTTCCCVYAGFDSDPHDRSIGPCFPA